MDIASLLVFAVLPKGQVPEPTLWLQPNGRITIEGREFQPKLANGARALRTHLGTAYDFNGVRAGIHFGDLPQLKLTDSITISLWINARTYRNDGPGAQVLFRGDDRNGVDPYFMAIHPDGTINFAVQSEDQTIRHVGTDLERNRWTQIVASWDSESGFLRMWQGGELVGLIRTKARPFAQLDNRFTPGVSIGNVQNDKGPHNQPFNGMIADLRLYRGAWTPDELGILKRVDDPPAQKVVTVN